MKSIFRRHSLITSAISKEIYSKHKEKFVKRFGEYIPTYAEVFDWINDACGIAIFINIVGHIKWDNSKKIGSSTMPSTTTIPEYQAAAFHYGELCSCPETFVDNWDGCADDAIDSFLSKTYGTEDVWYDEFTEAYDGSCEKYKSLCDYLKNNK